MKSVVIDASVILRFLLEQQPRGIQGVSTILRDAKKKKITLEATPLLPLEIGNGLRFTLTDQSLAGEVFEKFERLPIAIIPLTPVQVRKTIALAYICGTTVYDASYHILAIARGSEYITADRDYYQKAKHLGHITIIDL